MAVPVGTATVHIRPSFINFTKTISREISKAMPSIQKEAGSLGKAMGDGFAQESNGIAAEAQALSGQLAKAKDNLTKATTDHTTAVAKEVKLTNDVAVAEARLSELQSNASAKKSALIKAEGTLAEARRKLAVVSDQVADAHQRMTTASAEVEAVQTKLDSSLKKANTELEVSHQRSRNLRIAFGDLHGTMSRLSGISDGVGTKFKALAPHFASAAGSAALGSAHLAQFGATASLSAISVGAMGTAVAGMVGPLASLGASLAPLAGLGLALPGIAAGAGVVMGVLQVALAGVGNRLDNLKPQMDTLGVSIQDAFWAKATPAVNAVAAALLPVANQILPQVASGLGGWATALSGVLTSSAGVEAVRSILTNTAQAVEAARGGVAGFAAGLLNLAGAGSTYLPQLAAMFTNLGTQFQAWTARIVSDGSFQVYVANGVTVLTALGSVLGSIVGIFGSIGQAALNAGHLTISGLAGALAQVNTALQTEVWQARLTTFFQTTNAGVGVMSAAFGGLLTQIGNMSGTINLLVTSASASVASLVNGLTAALASVPVQNNVTTFLQGLPLLAQQAGALLTPLMTILTTGLALASQAAQAAAPVLGALLTPLANAVTLALPHLQRLIGVLGTELLSAAQIVAPVFQMFVQNALIPMTSVIGSLLPILSPVANILMAVLAPAFQLVGNNMNLVTSFTSALVTAFSSVVSAILPIVSTITGFLVPILSSLAQAVFPALTSAVTQIGSQFSSLLVQMQPVVNFLSGVLGPVFGAVFAFIGSTLAQFIGAVGNAISSAIGILSGLISFVQAVFTGNWSAAWSALQSIASNTLGLILNVIQAILLGNVLGVFRSAITGMLSVFTSGFSGIASVVRGGMTLIGNLVSGAMNLVRTLFTGGMNAAKQVVVSGISNVVTFFQQLPGKIVSALGGMAGQLRNVGGDMMRGLVNGISSGAGAVISAIGGAAQAAINKAKSILGIHSPSRVFRDEVGRQITAGMGVGIVRNTKAVLKPLNALSAKMLSAVETPSPWIAPGVQASARSAGSYGVSPISATQWRDLADVTARGGDTYNVSVPHISATADDVAAAISYSTRVNRRR